METDLQSVKVCAPAIYRDSIMNTTYILNEYPIPVKKEYKEIGVSIL